MMRRNGLGKLPALGFISGFFHQQLHCQSCMCKTNAPLNSEPPVEVPSGKKTTVSVNDFKSCILKNRIWAIHPAGKHVTVYVDSGIYAWIVMDRAGSSANALGEEFVKCMHQALDIVEKLVAENKARVVIIASAKSSFCVGADLDQLYPLTDRKMASEAAKMGHGLFNRIQQEPFPVVAAINGLALGGGFEMTLACHHRLLASNGSVGLPECLLGLLPGAGGTVRLQRFVGLATAVQWIMTSVPAKAPKAKKAGVLDAVIEAEPRWEGEERFFEGVRKWSGRLVDKPLKPMKRKNISLMDRFLERTSFGRKIVGNKTIEMLNKKTKGKYIAQYKALEAIIYSAAHSEKEGLAKERDIFSELLVTPEAKNQIALYFLDEGMKKSERKTGISKDKVPPVRKVGVIGAGVMGSGIVHYFANKGIPVAVKDVKQEAVDKGIEMVRGEFKTAVVRKKITPTVMEAKMKLVTGGTSDTVFHDVDVIVEAAVEVMDIKKKIIQEMENQGVINGKNIFATNTSSLSLTEMQTVSKYPERIVGMHFFNPVSKMPLVEVIKGKKTSAETAAVIFNLALKTGKKPIIVNDAPGFVVNRILGVYMAEASRLAIEEEVDLALIEKAMLNFGMPMGPFRLLDEVGLDIACHVGPVLSEGIKSKRFAVGSQVEQMMKDGYLGKKNGKGLYRYDAKGKETVMNTETLEKYFPQSKKSKDENEIVDRCVLLMVNEACYILQEGVAATPEDVDIGMIWGTGFPAFRGGLLQHADHRGLQAVVGRLRQFQDETGSDRYAPSPLLLTMVKEEKRFFPNRPFVPYKERSGYPQVKFY
ncbi:trifunctional enzyme alpha subunit, mitochondrial precursor-like protein [Trypanosoma theileri]|uniref:Trifunctional enzyme alpha subunit, mitochondrial-like protein n=1 Tax=Trypanosoma theileri TaxID=67003 RepID=A0A1X0NSD1_9TRYP|nr:trifunctional enzyme alpha subunit, mitochondrial precursor-like protein [Trypanosoma theileri]ORC87521.1 trifunctional enzyme alpha subunit, mitochondrial precursor-like protein [Trypanosoma theileri]